MFGNRTLGPPKLLLTTCPHCSLPSLVSSPRVRNLVQAEWVLQGADDMFVAVTSSYLPPLLSLYEIPAILIEI